MNGGPLSTAAAHNRPADSPAWAKKIVLLLDCDAHSRESRAKIMRTLGVTVHCASSTRVAHQRFDSGPYDLVLVDLGSDVEGAGRFGEEIRSKKPRQLLAFLVGRPLFVATSLKRKGALPSRTPRHSGVAPALNAAAPVNVLDFGEKVRAAEAEQVLDDLA